MIGQNVLNEVSGESSMVADFAYYHLNNSSKYFHKYFSPN